MISTFRFVEGFRASAKSSPFGKEGGGVAVLAHAKDDDGKRKR